MNTERIAYYFSAAVIALFFHMLHAAIFASFFFVFLLWVSASYLLENLRHASVRGLWIGLISLLAFVLWSVGSEPSTSRGSIRGAPREAYGAIYAPIPDVEDVERDTPSGNSSEYR